MIPLSSPRHNQSRAKQTLTHVTGPGRFTEFPSTSHFRPPEPPRADDADPHDVEVAFLVPRAAYREQRADGHRCAAGCRACLLKRHAAPVPPPPFRWAGANGRLPENFATAAIGWLWPVCDCRPSGFAARKLPVANYGTRPVAAGRVLGSRHSAILPNRQVRPLKHRPR